MSFAAHKALAAASVAGVLVWSPLCGAYPFYDNQGQGCIQCHGNGGPAPQFNETIHNAFFNSKCEFCHASPSGGGDLSTYTSGAGQGCRGCHGVNNGTNFTWGVGLRLHHLNAGVRPDAAGKRCGTCHTNDPAPSPESTLPVYYTRSDVTLKNPCLDNLDNDGNLLKDEADPACSCRITSISRQGTNIQVTWQSVVGRTNYLQAATNCVKGIYSSNFSDLGRQVIITGAVVGVTNLVDLGGAIASPTRYYRVRR